MEFVYGDFDNRTFYFLPTIGVSPSENGNVIFIGCFYWFIGLEIYE